MSPPSGRGTPRRAASAERQEIPTMLPLSMPRRAGGSMLLWLAATVIGAGLPGAAAQAQPMLYEQRLPEGFAFLRLANALPGAVTVKPDFGPAVSLGAEGATRISAYLIGEGVADRPVTLGVTEGNTTTELVVRVTAGGSNTVLLQRQGAAPVATVVRDSTEYNQTRARLTFYNAIPGCADGVLAVEPSGPTVFSAVPADAMRSRSINPVRAKVRAGCAGRSSPSLDLGQLEAGGQYSVWLMAPAGEPVSFLARDTIAPR